MFLALEAICSVRQEGTGWQVTGSFWLVVVSCFPVAALGHGPGLEGMSWQEERWKTGRSPTVPLQKGIIGNVGLSPISSCRNKYLLFSFRMVFKKKKKGGFVNSLLLAVKKSIS